MTPTPLFAKLYVDEDWSPHIINEKKYEKEINLDSVSGLWDLV